MTLQTLITTLTRQDHAFQIIAAISAFALISAYVAQYGLGMEPCILCLYQRIPFFVCLALAGVYGIWRIVRRRQLHWLANLVLLDLAGLSFAVNAAIAFYHSGVERHWWRSAVEGCAVPMPGETGPGLLETIMSAPAARCDDIPWADPVFGLSMANYNVALNAAMLVFCMAVMLMVLKRRSNPPAP